MALVDSSGLPLAPSAPVARPRPASEYMRGVRGITMGGWRPVLRPIQEDVRAGWQDAAARTIDLMQNVGWIAGGLQQAVANTVGTGLRLNAQPDHEALGISEIEASNVARQIERRFRTWASRPYECDIEGRRTFWQMQAAMLLNYFAFGESLCEIPWRERAGGTWGTKIRMLAPYRLSQRTDHFNRLVQGVYQDQDGLPNAYLIRRNDPWLGLSEISIPARDRFGRPRIVHVFDGMSETVRGISPLVPALAVARQFDQLANATTMAAIIQSVFAASITSAAPTEEVLSSLVTTREKARMDAQGVSPYDAWFEAQAGWYEKTHINLGVAGRIAHLFPDQKLEFHNSKSPNANYKDHATMLLREMARALGITYEGMTGDYAGVTFSSVKMSEDGIFRIVLYRRQNIVAPFCQAVYEAWLEEEIDRGWITFPGGMSRFLEHRAEACRAEWRGSPKPNNDDLKIAKAHQIWHALGVMSSSAISADIGLEYEDTVSEMAREREMREAAGVPEPSFVLPIPSPSSDDPADAADMPPGDGEEEDNADGTAP